jgi:hypothetical protein
MTLILACDESLHQTRRETDQRAAKDTAHDERVALFRHARPITPPDVPAAS